LTVPMMLLVSAVLVLLAEIATSTSIFILWHEPDCPEELLK
jgi:cyclic lactone autoinducer peptide